MVISVIYIYICIICISYIQLGSCWYSSRFETLRVSEICRRKATQLKNTHIAIPTALCLDMLLKTRNTSIASFSLREVSGHRHHRLVPSPNHGWSSCWNTDHGPMLGITAAGVKGATSCLPQNVGHNGRRPIWRSLLWLQSISSLFFLLLWL